MAINDRPAENTPEPEGTLRLNAEGVNVLHLRHQRRDLRRKLALLPFRHSQSNRRTYYICLPILLEFLTGTQINHISTDTVRLYVLATLQDSDEATNDSCGRFIDNPRYAILRDELREYEYVFKCAACNMAVHTLDDPLRNGYGATLTYPQASLVEFPDDQDGFTTILAMEQIWVGIPNITPESPNRNDPHMASICEEHISQE
ncbi:hypothetical protein Aduo_000611 [Ancylostoma duodenale]